MLALLLQQREMGLITTPSDKAAPAPPHEEGALGWELDCIRAARTGHREAFAPVVEHYGGRVYGMLYRMLGSPEEAEDIAQEAFARAYRFLDRYDEQRPFRAWLFTIASNLGLNALRARQRRGFPVHFEEERDPETTVAPRAVAKLEKDELRERIDAALRRLPERTATLVHLYYREEMSIREAAAILGMNESAAKVALCRARARMREWLVEEEQ